MDDRHLFSVDTAVAPLGDGRYGARFTRAWWIERGPNGGVVAAVVVRAIEAEVAARLAASGDGVGRPIRSFTMHYLSPPAEGPVEVAVRVERSGRTLTFVSARLEQGGRTLGIASAALGADSPGPVFRDLDAPSFPSPDAVGISDRSTMVPIPLRARYEERWVLGDPPFSPDPRRPDAAAEIGGWIRLVDPVPYDAPLLAALTDAWPPPIFSKLTERVGVPTIDLTIHFRAPVPATMTATDWAACRFRSRVASDGFIEEDGEVWSPDGVLLAQSRQLALLMPIEG